MKKIILLALLAFFSYQKINAQDNDDAVSITLSSDLLEADLYYLQKLHLSANLNVGLSGSIVSENSVQILPKPGCGIQILPVPEGYTGSGYAARDKKGSTTVIKSKGSGAGRPAAQATIYPNPVQNILTYNTPGNYAISTSVYDMNGVLKLTTRTKPASTGTLNVGNLPAANYILKIDLIDSRFITIQFIKY